VSALPVIISDEALRQTGLSDEEALVEIACCLFDAEKLHLWPAAKLAGLSRGEFESELASRGIDVHRLDQTYLDHELEMSAKSWKLDENERRQ